MIYRRFTEEDFSRMDGCFQGEDNGEPIYPPDLWESNESFRARLAQFPDGCWVCTTDEGESVAYMFSHPWVKWRIVPLDCKDFMLPRDPDCYYIHDLAVIRGWRNRGIAKELLRIAVVIARTNGFDEIRGVSVLGSHHYWIKHGFEVICDTTYGAGSAKVVTLRVND